MIDTIYAWVADDPTKEHGILGFYNPLSNVPLQAVTSKEYLARSFKAIVPDSIIRFGVHVPVKLVKFQLVEILDEVKP